jgi:hypothetical protein
VERSAYAKTRAASSDAPRAKGQPYKAAVAAVLKHRLRTFNDAPNDLSGPSGGTFASSITQVRSTRSNAEEFTMKRCFADYVARLFAMTAAVGITTLTIFVHAADRSSLGAPMATSTTLAMSQRAPAPADAQAAQRVIALAANEHH